MRKRIRISNHKPDCLDPFHCFALNKRVTVEGKQKDVHHTNFCPSCGTYQQVDFTGDNYEYEMIGDILKHKFKTRTKAFGNLDKGFSSEEIKKIYNRTRLTIDKDTTTAYLPFRERVKTGVDSLTKEISNEESLRKKIKGLEGFYKTVCRRYRIYDLEKLCWDPKLVKRFLTIKPTKNQLVRALIGPNLEFVVSARPGKRRNECIGWVKGEDEMFLTRDDETWIKIAMAEIKTRNEVMKAIIKKKARPIQRRKKKMLPYLTVVN